MEYVSGGDLYNLIEQRGRITEPEARIIFQQIISAVEYCHNNQVTHRDLKPENILLDEQNRVKVGDFGLANLMRDGEFFKTSCGSPNYAAPEVLSGTMYCGSEVDIWSCGVVLYALLAGTLPFDETRLSALYEKIKTGEYHMPYHFSEPVRDLVARMLTVDPIARITTFEIKHHSWFRPSLPAYISKNTGFGPHSTAVCLTELRAHHTKRIVDMEVFEACRAIPAFVGGEEHSLLLEKLVNRKAGPIGVCYDLLYDAKQKRISQPSHFPVPAIPVTFPHPPPTPPDEEAMEIDLPAFHPSNWVYGFRCKLDGLSLMQLIYEGFRRFSLEWKIVTNFRSMVRTLGYKQHLHDIEGNTLTPVAYGEHLKFSVGIYRFGNAFVMDLALVHGQTLKFLDLCTKLYNFLILKPEICTP